MPCPPARARLAASCSRSAADPAVIAVIAVIVIAVITDPASAVIAVIGVIVVIAVITDPAVMAVIGLSVRRLVQHCGQMTAGGGAVIATRNGVG